MLGLGGGAVPGAGRFIRAHRAAVGRSPPRPPRRAPVRAGPPARSPRRAWRARSALLRRGPGPTPASIGFGFAISCRPAERGLRSPSARRSTRQRACAPCVSCRAGRCRSRGAHRASEAPVSRITPASSRKTTRMSTPRPCTSRWVELVERLADDSPVGLQKRRAPAACRCPVRSSARACRRRARA